MAGLAAKAVPWAAQKLLNKEMNAYKDKKVAGGEDPFYTYVTDRRGKRRKVKKQIPDFIPEHDALCLAKAKKWAYRLDLSLFDLCGIRFGWSSVLGLIPGFGDVIDVFLAYYLVYRWASKIDGGLPKSLQSKMMFYLMLDFLLGLVPFAGDLADAVFRANTKNVLLLENYLKDKYAPKGMDAKAKRRSGYQFLEKQGEGSPSRPAGGPVAPGAAAGAVAGGHHEQSAEDYDDEFEPMAAPVQQQQQQPGKSAARGAKRGSRWFGQSREQPADLESGRRAGPEKR